MKYNFIFILVCFLLISFPGIAYSETTCTEAEVKGGELLTVDEVRATKIYQKLNGGIYFQMQYGGTGTITVTSELGDRYYTEVGVNRFLAAFYEARKNGYEMLIHFDHCKGLNLKIGRAHV